MLHSLLAWTMGLGSLSLFASGFFFPEIRRKNDLIWSGIGLFYALVMAIDSGRLRGGMVLEELASVILIVWFCLQVLQQRRRQVPADKQTPIPNSVESWTIFFKAGWGRLQLAFSDPDSLESPYEDEEASLLDVGKISAAITGLFRKGEPASPPTVPTSPATTAETTALEDDWDEEPSHGEAPPAAPSTPAEVTPLATSDSAAAVVVKEPPADLTPEAPEPASTDTLVEPSSEESQPIEEAISPPKTEVVSGESEASTEPEATHSEASVDNPEGVMESTDHEPITADHGEQSEGVAQPETSLEQKPQEEESWPPPDAPT